MGSKPVNAEKSSLAGRGTGSVHVPLTVLSPGRLVSPPAKVMAGGAPGVLLLRSLVAGGGAVLAFQFHRDNGPVEGWLKKCRFELFICTVLKHTGLTINNTKKKKTKHKKQQTTNNNAT